MESNQLIFKNFLERTKTHPEKIAILCERGSVTYKTLFREAMEVATTISKLQLDSNNICILGAKSKDSIVSILGSLFAGCTYVTPDINQPAARLDVVFSLLDPSLLILTDLSSKLRRELKQIKKIPPYVLNLSSENILDIFESGNIIPLSNNNKEFTFSYSDSQIAYILFTSGSTGQPKGVCISHRAAVAALEMFQSHIQYSDADCIGNQAALCFDLSMFDIFGALSVGATLVLIPPEITALPDRFFQAIEEQKVTSIFTTPSTLDFLLKNRITTKVNSSLKKVLFSGEPLNMMLLSSLRNTFTSILQVWNLYGATEIPYALAECLGNKFQLHSHSTFSLKGENVEIMLRNTFFDENKNLTIGELLVKSPAMLSGYLNSDHPKICSSALVEDKWYPTGDLASVDSAGFVRLHGRNDRQVKVKGHRVELDEIEYQLSTSPEIREVAVLYSKEHKVIEAYIELSPEILFSPETSELIERFCEVKLPNVFCPQQIYFIKKMPYTATGKKNRQLLENKNIDLLI